MKKNILYIGSEIPKGWGEEYPVFIPNSISELREIVWKYISLISNITIGIDMRSLGFKAQDSILKLLEESRVSVVLRMNELVKGTILSRVDVVYKRRQGELKVKLEDILLEGKGKIGEKVSQLI